MSKTYLPMCAVPGFKLFSRAHLCLSVQPFGVRAALLHVHPNARAVIFGLQSSQSIWRTCLLLVLLPLLLVLLLLLPLVTVSLCSMGKPREIHVSSPACPDILHFGLFEGRADRNRWLESRVAQIVYSKKYMSFATLAIRTGWMNCIFAPIVFFVHVSQIRALH